MPGVKGAGGPPPKRENQRRRVNKTAPIEKADGAPQVEVPKADPAWNVAAGQWYESLAKSGQSRFYEPSDWGLAWLIAESISREMNPQPMVVGRGDDAVVEMVSLPPKGASLSAWLKAMTSLMVTEGDRRRLRLELDRPSGKGAEEVSRVSELDEYRRRLSQPG